MWCRVTGVLSLHEVSFHYTKCFKVFITTRSKFLCRSLHEVSFHYAKYLSLREEVLRDSEPLFLKPGSGHVTRARQRAAVSVRHLHTPGRSYTLIRRVALDRVGTCHVNEYVTHFLKFTGHPSAGTRRHNGLFACF